MGISQCDVRAFIAKFTGYMGLCDFCFFIFHDMESTTRNGNANTAYFFQSHIKRQIGHACSCFGLPIHDNEPFSRLMGEF